MITPAHWKRKPEKPHQWCWGAPICMFACAGGYVPNGEDASPCDFTAHIVDLEALGKKPEAFIFCDCCLTTDECTGVALPYPPEVAWRYLLGRGWQFARHITKGEFESLHRVFEEGDFVLSPLPVQWYEDWSRVSFRDAHICPECVANLPGELGD